MTDRELLQLARDAMTSLDGVGSVIQWRGQWEKVHAAVAAIDATAPQTVAQPANTDSVPGSPASKVTRPSEQDAPGSSIVLGAEGEQ